MLRIRKAQMEAFSASLKEAFIQRMVRHLRTDFPEQLILHELGSDELEPLVRRGMADAEKYGVVNEEDIQLYLECLVLLNPNFDCANDTKWASSILRRDDWDGKMKMDAINDYLLFGLEKSV